MNKLSNINYSGQSGIFDPDEFAWPVHAIGVGGIGSQLVGDLIETGVRKIILWDDDKVEDKNRGSQKYRAIDVDRLKVEATIARLKREMLDYSEITIHPERIAESFDRSRFEGVVFSGVDSMKSREYIWQAVKGNRMVPLYIDGRIGGMAGQILAVNPNKRADIELYESWLKPNKVINDMPCNERTMSFPFGHVSHFMCRALVARFGKGVVPKRVVVFNLRTMFFQAFD